MLEGGTRGGKEGEREEGSVFSYVYPLFFGSTTKFMFSILAFVLYILFSNILQSHQLSGVLTQALEMNETWSSLGSLPRISSPYRNSW